MFIDWKTLCCKDSILPKFLHRLNVIPNKFQKALFFPLWSQQVDSKIYLEIQGQEMPSQS